MRGKPGTRLDTIGPDVWSAGPVFVTVANAVGALMAGIVVRAAPIIWWRIPVIAHSWGFGSGPPWKVAPPVRVASVPSVLQMTGCTGASGQILNLRFARHVIPFTAFITTEVLERHCRSPTRLSPRRPE